MNIHLAGFSSKNFIYSTRVCYLAQARAMARVVLAQIDFTRAKPFVASANFACVTVIMCLHSNC